MSEFERAEQAAAAIRERCTLRPQIALVLGSGLGAFADTLAGAVRIPSKEIVHFPRPTAEGHAGNLVLGQVGAATVAAMQGRVHF
ncbi:MAG: purine-nucleoside phosphorylase, partial [Terriglobales bacterium]